MSKSLYQQGFRFYVLMDSDFKPVVGPIIVRKKRPRAKTGVYVDITTCLVPYLR